MIKQVIVVREDLKMNRGKIAAQVAHAAMLFIVDRISLQVDGENNGWINRPFSLQQRDWLFGESGIDNWFYGGMTKIVVSVPHFAALEMVYANAKLVDLECHMVIDKTLGVETCCAIGPDYAEKIDTITGNLPLLR
jgi:peptidyl-tRNA hydrolase, PTH2 family